MQKDLFDTRTSLKVGATGYQIHSLKKLEEAGQGRLARLPYSIRVLLEGVLRRYDGKTVTQQDVLNLAHWEAKSDHRPAMPFFPGRVIMQDFTGVPTFLPFLTKYPLSL